MRILSAAICILFAGLATQKAHAATDVQMLPPTQTDGSGCDFIGASNQVLLLHGTGAPGTGSAINCNTRFTADPSGNIYMGGNINTGGDLSLSGVAELRRDGSAAYLF